MCSVEQNRVLYLNADISNNVNALLVEEIYTGEITILLYY